MIKAAASFLVVLLCLLPLCGCASLAVMPDGGTGGPAPSASASAVTTPSPKPETTAPTPAPTPTPTPAPQGVLTENEYALFTRVGFSGAGDGSPAVAKWASPIRIQIAGQPGDGDRKALSDLAGKLKGVYGMPDIAFVIDGGNIRIGYLPLKRSAELDASFNGSDPAQVSIRSEGFSPVSAALFVSDELADQQERDSCLAGLLFRCLGLAQDPMNEYAGSALNLNASASGPSSLDWLMLALLYSPEVKPGMSASQAIPVVRSLDPKATIGVSANNPDIGNAGVLAYFNEVGFWWAEGAGDGIASKWASSVKLQIAGTPTAEQQALLDEYVGRLNKIEGFPGFVRVQSGGALVLSYQPAAELKKADAAMTTGESGYIMLTQDRGKITKCTIGVATDFGDKNAARTQFLRLLMKAIGFPYTSDAWPDSILNYSATVQAWSLLDWKMAELLYRADVKPGAKRAAVMKMLGSIIK